MFFINRFNKCLMLLISFLAVSNLSYSADNELDFEEISDSAKSKVINLDFENATDSIVQVKINIEDEEGKLDTFSFQINPKKTYRFQNLNLENIKNIYVSYGGLISTVISPKINLNALNMAVAQSQDFVKVIINPYSSSGWNISGNLSFDILADVQINKEKNFKKEEPEKPEESSAEEKKSEPIELKKPEESSIEKNLKFKEPEQSIDPKQYNIVLSEMLSQPLASIKEKTIEPWDVFELENPYEEINDKMSYMIYMNKLVTKMNELKDRFVNDEFSKKIKRKYGIEDVKIQSKIINKNYYLLQEILNKIEK